MEKAPLGDEMCRSDLRSFTPKISRTEVLHGHGRPVAVHGHRVQTLTEDRPGYAMWETGDILKVSKLSTPPQGGLHPKQVMLPMW